jgi:hypothetical protein
MNLSLARVYVKHSDPIFYQLCWHLGASQGDIGGVRIVSVWRPTRGGDVFKAFDGEIAVRVSYVVPDARAIEQGR